MKRITTLWLGVVLLGFVGAVQAAPVNLFTFIDQDSTVLSFAANDPRAIQLFDSSNNLGLEVTSTASVVGQLIAGSIVPDTTTGGVSFSATFGGVTTGGSGFLPGGVFSVGLAGGATLDSAIAEQSGYKFIFNNGVEFTIDDISAVPVPAAGIMLLSALAGLLVVGRKGRTEEVVAG